MLFATCAIQYSDIGPDLVVIRPFAALNEQGATLDPLGVWKPGAEALRLINLS